MTETTSLKKNNNMIALKNQVVVKPFEADNVSAGGIIVPDSFKKEAIRL